MGKYFTVAELTRSAEAAKRGFDNTPPPDVKVRLTTLINSLLDPIREKWGKPIMVNSGFRCPVLNTAIKGAVNSQHMKGEAADITAGSPQENERLFAMILAMKVAGEIQFDQIIDESGRNKVPYSWVHISYKGSGNRGEVRHM